MAKKAVKQTKVKQSKAGIKQDKGIKAKAAGKRVSASGNTYTETRSNRSDADRKKKI